MNSQQVKEFLDYLQKNNSWEAMIQGQLTEIKRRISLKDSFCFYL